jgi:hypothetical protein
MCHPNPLHHLDGTIEVVAVLPGGRIALKAQTAAVVAVIVAVEAAVAYMFAVGHSRAVHSEIGDGVIATSLDSHRSSIPEPGSEAEEVVSAARAQPKKRIQGSQGCPVADEKNWKDADEEADAASVDFVEPNAVGVHREKNDASRKRARSIGFVVTGPAN